MLPATFPLDRMTVTGIKSTHGQVEGNTIAPSDTTRQHIRRTALVDATMARFLMQAFMGNPIILHDRSHFEIYAACL